MRKMLNFQCPCGYNFKTFGSINDAKAIVKLHVENFHKDILPFGITNDEALELLNQGHKPKISARTAFSVQTESAHSFKNTDSTSPSWLDLLLGEDIEVEHTGTERKMFQVKV